MAVLVLDAKEHPEFFRKILLLVFGDGIGCYAPEEHFQVDEAVGLKEDDLLVLI